MRLSTIVAEMLQVPLEIHKPGRAVHVKLGRPVLRGRPDVMEDPALQAVLEILALPEEMVSCCLVLLQNRLVKSVHQVLPALQDPLVRKVCQDQLESLDFREEMDSQVYKARPVRRDLKARPD